jgi:hypothetical protein
MERHFVEPVKKAKDYLNPVIGSRIITVRIPGATYCHYVSLSDLGLSKAPYANISSPHPEMSTILLLTGQRHEEIRFSFTGYLANQRALDFLKAFGKELFVHYIPDEQLKDVYKPLPMSSPQNCGEPCFTGYSCDSGAVGVLLGP